MILRLWLLRLMILGELFVLYQCMRIIVEDYRERQEDRRKRDQCPRQVNELSRVPLHFGRRLRLFFGKDRKQASHVFHRSVP